MPRAYLEASAIPKTRDFIVFGEWRRSTNRQHQRFVFPRAGIQADTFGQSASWGRHLLSQAKETLRARHAQVLGPEAGASRQVAGVTPYPHELTKPHIFATVFLLCFNL